MFPFAKKTYRFIGCVPSGLRSGLWKLVSCLYQGTQPRRCKNSIVLELEILPVGTYYGNSLMFIMFIYRYRTGIITACKFNLSGHVYG